MKKMNRFLLVWGLFLLLTGCGENKTHRFRLLDASKTGIDFQNTITENDSINVFEFMNVYTGAGVAVGDIDNDGLTDVYFSGNMVSGRLYRNKGNMEFEDITESAGLLNSRWGTGVSMVDVNQDGFLDIYICVSGSAEVAQRANMLYINNGDMTFTERAEEYGLADTRQSMHSAFFDYDKDGDLDMYLLVNPAAYEYNVNVSKPREVDGQSVSNDRLYKNMGNGRFEDVSREAGILLEGYGLGVGVSDINGDGWPDMYVSNDFIGNDILYINQKDGTFKDRISEQIKHTSYAGMGNDVADIDNNGEPDILVLDMRPEDNERQKMIISSTGYDRFQIMLEAGYNAQYSRNTLQLNQGQGKFSEIGFLAGISSTDWSWSPLLADYDNDGRKDLYVTNGFLRDLGDLDYIHYQKTYDTPVGDVDTKIRQKLKSISELPMADLPNYAYRNKGDMTFEKVSDVWGVDKSSCSHGAAYADLDNDGDLDLLVNNMDQPAFVYENVGTPEERNHYLRIQLKGSPGNLQGIGAKLKVTTEDSEQFYQHYLSRGYESSVDPVVHFGLGKALEVKSVEVWWPDGSYQALTAQAVDTTLSLQQSNASKNIVHEEMSQKTFFIDATDSLGVSFEHHEDDVVDFKLQPILPHMHSRNGPGVAVADIDGDGLEDFFVGGASGQSGKVFHQNEDGTFRSGMGFEAMFEDMGALFFDANGDGYKDLYVVSGGVVVSADSEIYQDRLYLNDGKGNFKRSDALPEIRTSGSCVVANDYDKDGDLDLFVGGRVDPGKYPMPAHSYLLENRSGESGEAKFIDVSEQIEGWNELTMVTSGLWTDYDNDGWVDLIAVGEFMPIVVFHNENGKLVLQKETTGLTKTEGWWNGINGGDFDQDGDTDYILGNLGLNSKYTATEEEPLCIYAKDYDKDGRVDPIMCYYIEGENHLAHSRDEIIGQVNAMRSRFKTYRSYAETNFEKSFLPEELEDAYVVKSYNFASSYLENLGGGKFALRPLPLTLQTAPLEGIAVGDFDRDGNEDVLFTGNSYATEAATGRYDAFLGAFFKGDGESFESIPLEKSGFLSDFDASGLAIMDSEQGRYVLSAQSNGPLKVFGSRPSKAGSKRLTQTADVAFATVRLKNGKEYRKEFYLGSGYLSQSSRSILLNRNIQEIEITDSEGNTKIVYTNEAIK
ncbi:VCBS repeat-containing protein [Zobellia galactanivorans]|uniref:VCBS repeat-containing protein n=1 Tax=Zobellia galactanivorans (strain DSM 12802 / CCUG 47099 / CIP 106680 / NCIMB 13871 / Dsij) TaxID=63186 RepID=UPI0026E3FF26|nr:VCBS repeat-containing protein [Zobellia galactanivorans]MDO6810071.1 VCBS repeat-containing protein [Zobellia galactanivorans]